MPIFINPGAGPVDRATMLNAERNMRHFIDEMGLEGVTRRRLSHKGCDGRWLFRLSRGRRRVEVDMPGCPLKIVRDLWLKKTFESFGAPRLYVDQSSFNWTVALESARGSLTGRWT